MNVFEKHKQSALNELKQRVIQVQHSPSADPSPQV